MSLVEAIPRKLRAIAMLGLVAIVLVAYGDYRYVSGAAASVAELRSGLCKLLAKSNRSGVVDKAQLRLIAGRALIREQIDARAGNLTAAHSDADTAAIDTRFADQIAPETLPGCPA